jgi:ATP-binding cassette subfamily C protein
LRHELGKLSFLKRGIVEIGIFSAAVNLLMLVIPIYLMQVYDRVIPAFSTDTLIYLSVAALISLAVLGLLEVVRGQYANRLGARIDAQFGSAAFVASMKAPRAGFGDVQPLRDLATIRAFAASRALFFLFDAPFAPIFVVILYFVHPVLFYLTTLGAVTLVAVAVLNQATTAKSGAVAAETLIGAMNSAQSFARNFETLKALGMLSNVTEAWGRRFAVSLEASDRLARTNAFYSGLSRTLRLVLQIAILGAGAYLVVEGEMTAGMIFAASVISSRALQPLDQIIGGWRQIVDSYRAWSRIRANMRSAASSSDDMVALPAPAGALSVEQIIYQVPNADPNTPPLIKRVSFTMEAGERLAIIEPSGAGKSTFGRLIVGAIEPRSGVVRIDSADIRNWDSDALGKHIGYLPQEVELFPGTIAQNIARFDHTARDEAVIAAAQRAHAHELILGQKKGYATDVGPGEVRLSGGERQRIGLARAFYGDPKLLVLDEPNANLDAEGEMALEKAMLEARARQTTVLIITHKISIAANCDRILFLRNGQIELLGPSREVIQRLNQPTSRQQAANASDSAPTTGSEPSSTPASQLATASFGQVIRTKVN